MKIKTRQDFLVVLTVAAFALLVGVDYIATPLVRGWSARQTQIRELRQQVKEGEQLLKREPSVRSRWDEMRANALPANNSAAEQLLLKALDGWRNDTGAELTSILPQWKSDSTNYLTLNCRMELGGSLGTLSRFLYELERSPLAVRVDAVELGARDKEGQQLTLGLEVSGLALAGQPEKK